MSTDDQRRPADIARQIIALILILGGTVAANILAVSVTGNDTGELANQTFSNTVYFFPATFVFATIWPVIYLGLVAIAIHQVLPSQAANPRYRQGTYVLAANLLLNAGWIVVFGAERFGWSLVMIVPIVITAIIAYRRLGVGQTPDAPAVERVVKVALSIYTAWLTIAVIANASAALASIGWDGFGIAYETWGVIMSTVGIGLGTALLVGFRDPVFSLVYAYAYLGIVVRQVGTAEGVALAAGIGAGVFAVMFVFSVILMTRRRP